MQTIGVLLLAAATAGDGFGYSKPGVGLKKLLRPHVVVNGPAPPGGPIVPGVGAALAGTDIPVARVARPAPAPVAAADRAALEESQGVAGGSPTSRARSTSSTPTA